MPKFSIAFITPEKKNMLRHRIIESAEKEIALRQFFNEEIVRFYSKDDQGYFYFKEDFFDSSDASGSIVELD
jgi:hypothetical protein